MSAISHRACMIGVNDEGLDRFIDELKSFLIEVEVPEAYTVNVYKDQVTCCGYMPIGVGVEIEGPKAQPIEALDEKILCKIKEICGREHIQYHECSPMELLQSYKGEVFIQG